MNKEFLKTSASRSLIKNLTSKIVLCLKLGPQYLRTFSIFDQCFGDISG